MEKQGTKILSPYVHGFIDYALVVLFFAAPTVLGFGGTPRIACYLLAAVHLSMTLLTAFPHGLVKLIPFPVHGAIEAVVAPVLLVLPWVVGFSDVHAARNFFLVTGGAVAVTWLLTDYKAALSSATMHDRQRQVPA